jgi:hypothetical protein
VGCHFVASEVIHKDRGHARSLQSPRGDPEKVEYSVGLTGRYIKRVLPLEGLTSRSRSLKQGTMEPARSLTQLVGNVKTLDPWKRLLLQRCMRAS